MLEWYRRNFGLAEIVADTTQLIAAALDNSELSATAVTLSYRDAFRDFAGIDVLDASPNELAKCAQASTELEKAIGDDRDAWLDLVLAQVIEPQLPENRITVLQHFPASKAALAKYCPTDPRFADRFEAYLGGVELANGYVELTDAAEQRRRFDRDLALRRQSGLADLKQDELLLSALDAGMPACAGVALGVERLHMVLDQTGDIGDVVTFIPEENRD